MLIYYFDNNLIQGRNNNNNILPTRRKLDFDIPSNQKEYDCGDNFLLIMNQAESHFARNQKENVITIIFLLI